MVQSAPMLTYLWNTRTVTALRWAAALGYTLFIIAIMLMPGEQSLAEDLSEAGGGSDATDAVGHVLLFGAVVVLWWQALHPRRRALLMAVGMGLLLGLGTEALQSVVPLRGMAAIDFAANGLGVALAAAALLSIERVIGQPTPH